MADYPKSLKTGTTPANKAVLNAVAAANLPPVDQNSAHAQVGFNVNLNLVLSEDAGGTYDAKVWWFYADADKWVEDLAVGTISVTANGTAAAVLVPSAATAAYVEVLNFAGGARASAWFIGRYSRSF